MSSTPAAILSIYLGTELHSQTKHQLRTLNVQKAHHHFLKGQPPGKLTIYEHLFPAAFNISTNVSNKRTYPSLLSCPGAIPSCPTVPTCPNLNEASVKGYAISTTTLLMAVISSRQLDIKAVWTGTTGKIVSN